jgi:hypothetical protein
MEGGVYLVTPGRLAALWYRVKMPGSGEKKPCIGDKYWISSVFWE